MSIMYCMDHDCYYDSDFVECPKCEEEETEQFVCQSIFNAANEIQDCTCGKCK